MHAPRTITSLAYAAFTHPPHRSTARITARVTCPLPASPVTNWPTFPLRTTDSTASLRRSASHPPNAVGEAEGEGGGIAEAEAETEAEVGRGEVGGVAAEEDSSSG